MGSLTRRPRDHATRLYCLMIGVLIGTMMDNLAAGIGLAIGIALSLEKKPRGGGK